PAYPGGFNLADAVVLPWLRHEGIGHIDRLILSHGDQDHAGAASALVRAISVEQTLSGEPGRVAVAARHCDSGMSWHWDGVEFRFIQPREPRPRHGNNASCVLLVTAASGKLLLTGDAETPIETALIPRLQTEAPIDVVVAGHHGSATSSSPAFVQTVRARHVIYANGYRNRYGFPRPEVDRRWAAAGARRWRTDGCGRIQVLFQRTPRRVRLATEVDSRSPFWWPSDVPCDGGQAALWR
ncbi:MAG: MBL fold metallo-hydrolase, partial [Gammaproteobacteria bacterium]